MDHRLSIGIMLLCTALASCLCGCDKAEDKRSPVGGKQAPVVPAPIAAAPTDEQVAALVKEADGKVEADAAGAMAAYQKAANARPNDYMIWFRLAVAGIKAGRKPEAQTALDHVKALLKDPSESQSVTLKQAGGTD